MTGADAAAAAWLAKLPAGERAAAHAYTDWRLLIWCLGGLVLVGACLALARTGAIRRLTSAIPASGRRPWLADAAAAGLVAPILASLNGLVDAVAHWRADQILGRGGPALAARLGQALIGVAPIVIAAVLLVPLALWLMRRLPRAWPAIVGAAATLAIVAAIWLPYALCVGPPSTPLPPGPMRIGLMQLIADAGLPASDVHLASDPGFDSDVNGGFGHAKVTIGPQMAAGPVAEARAMIGHIMGHWAHGDILAVSLVLGAAMLAGCFAIAWFAAPLARRIGGDQITGPGDPAALPAAAIILILSFAVAGLAEAGYLRWANVRADAFSLDHAREPDGLAAVLEREWDHQSVDPSAIEEALFYTHPAMTGRIRHAMAWKAAHGV
ncbi:MAG TPA: M48 family metalloprotease [Caulobacteraceae bacterium]|jgi:STE24 endopeptidase|nr:M48 family metalloprotease [Caulobacteraceae bacterium]